MPTRNPLSHAQFNCWEDYIWGVCLGCCHTWGAGLAKLTGRRAARRAGELCGVTHRPGPRLPSCAGSTVRPLDPHIHVFFQGKGVGASEVGAAYPSVELGCAALSMLRSHVLYRPTEIHWSLCAQPPLPPLPTEILLPQAAKAGGIMQLQLLLPESLPSAVLAPARN